MAATGADEEPRAKAMFGFSILYLFGLYALLLGEKLFGLPALNLAAVWGWV